ncbi:2-succinyl-5-enolpyruvyl-6-hydroxy-3-cyclohexene-1-carboxylic-acid synthase [Synoicihabitans lomoniglobus]|uniref:2-succinyl-5-enolpyruvyl-6-hydroxy-3-cyclohexene-1-carboxylate synthase n=1 Tax=Synoicihabitans lomoniglobus TaxID=2909285 RepID=A0AAF0CS69_9BACT|nr:2-succinyl-5-enolpyruvyl-6-hydroxy-3-cyclohexene-1-carboxylic-acid synthase [Opitutaceae bacterium LMO-M01]WED67060.1 2-succinyl-5-enolpyruvyl-6-hydroxy-3-cyclohexene-1-carboxylic-acid synthase [Opitutaceae bacterium LMO-M01]
MMTIDFRNTNSLWCSVAVETLHRCGLRHAVVSPGSRSTPLTMALVAHPQIETVPVLDERSAGFFALGLARRTHRAVVLVCTSGSAGAHYLPALIEARESRVPLLVITADRPPEMRDCASGQTIDQHKLFGDYALWYHELAVPEPRLELLGYLRQTLRQAWQRAAAGPVHLNAPFRDPLPPVADDSTAALAIDESFFAQPEAPTTERGQVKLHQRVTTARGIFIAGPAQPADPTAYAAAIGDLARSTGWPILADVLSPLRQNAPADVTVITTYDTLLRNETQARDLTPRYVIALEAWPTSKVLRQWLEQSQAEILMVSEHAGGRDAIHGKTRAINAPVTALAIDGAPIRDAAYLRAWATAEQRGRDRLDSWMASEAAKYFEGRIAWNLAQCLPEGAALCVANSMPVRDLEYFWPASNRGIEVFFSRGANGIDGTLSTALGVAHDAGRPVVLLTGDLAFLHDANGLLSAAVLRGGLTVVLINNAGGGIFEHLPVAAFDPPFERYFATPQHVDFAPLCAAHGVAYQLIHDHDELVHAVKKSSPTGVRVLEIRTDRKADAATRKRLFRELAR